MFDLKMKKENSYENLERLTMLHLKIRMQENSSEN